MAKESDRGATLVAAAALDDRLLGVLRAFFTDSKASKELLEGYSAPLGTFASRASAASALGLIQKNELNEITIIRKIRNEFGHDWETMSFDTPEVAKYCRKLPWLGPAEYESGASHKSRFNAAVAILLTDLMWRELLVGKEKRKDRIWPNKMRGTGANEA